MTIEINGTTGISGVNGSATTPAIQGDNDTNTGISFDTDEVNIVTGGTTAVTVDSSQNVGIGTTSPSVELSLAGSDPQLVLWEGSDGASSSKVQLGTGTTQGFINVHKGDGTRTVQINSDGVTYFNGGDVGIGTSSPEHQLHIADSGSTAIQLEDTSTSTRFRIQNGGSVLKIIETGVGERAMISSSGYLKASNNGSYVGSGSTYHEFSQSINDSVLVFEASSATYNYSEVFINAIRAASSSFNFLRLTSSDFNDTEFYLRGDGNAYADGSWNGGGADYAEYFEWSDGNTSSEDRRGISVVLDGDKIREAVAGEEPIGVISGNPSVVGDADIDRWKGKYLRDDYGTYIQEDYEVEDEDGNTVTQQRRKLNPDYNPDIEYISREDRPEWETVGLMGKLRIRKGQVTGSRWIKMRDISDTVEEWLVR